jgi:tetratricopeptide (TPR) repeat protein
MGSLRAGLIAAGLAMALPGAGPACAKKIAPVATPDLSPRLNAAESALRAGCFDCLEGALREFTALSATPGLSAEASGRAWRGRADAALMLELRARELGMPGEDFLTVAREVLAGRPDLQPDYAAAVETVENEPWRVQRFEGAEPGAAKRRLAIRQNLASLLAARRARADRGPLDAYSWLAFACGQGTREDRLPEALAVPLNAMRDAPVVIYRIATCTTPEAEPLTRLLEAEPRFAELNFFLGHAAIGRLRPDEAEAFYHKAFQWRQQWPAVTAALGNLYVAFEEFERALDFYDRTLASIPSHQEGRLGRVRALSYLERHDAAFAAIDEMLNAAVRVFPGEAYYWRAWNHAKLSNLDEAWTAIEQAGALWVNSEVAKLAGLIAYQRGQLEVALTRFQSARKLNPGDCEVLFNIGSIQVESRSWAPGADTFQGTASCLENARASLTDEIAQITASDTTPERKARQIAKRQEMIANAARMLATSYFNAAVSNFNLTRRDAARMFAEKIIEDERFGARAKELLQRLDPPNREVR